ncbi:hypothetical protein EGW08_004265 [Elysia chlorotica]|uniref:Uncharacterized protein n=1 Tax=Elysia chlorotica TaxID=188477 RepID=A0A433U2D9_ELYCH|nr:hypothetical protein EGW08_004265 [Elysia chlorotica]
MFFLLCVYIGFVYITIQTETLNKLNNQMKTKQCVHHSLKPFSIRLLVDHLSTVARSTWVNLQGQAGANGAYIGSTSDGVTSCRTTQVSKIGRVMETKMFVV